MDGETIYYSKNTWNLARGVASDVRSVARSAAQTKDIKPPNEGEFEEDSEIQQAYRSVESENDVWPFEGLADMIRFVDECVGIDNNPDNWDFNTIAQEISTLVKNDPKYEHRSEPPQSDSKTPVDNAGHNSSAAGEDPASADKGTVVSEESEQDSDTATVDPASTTGGNKSFSDNKRENRGDVTPIFEIAEQLHRCFKQMASGLKYRDIRNAHDIPFPDRSVVLHFVRNVNEASKREEIDEIKRWVSEWYEDEKAVAEENNLFARSPMGATPRAN